MTNRHLHVGPGGIHCRCCLPPPGSKARRMQFRRAKRREARAHFAAQDDETDWYCAFGCGRLIEEHECGPYCQQCRWYAESYDDMLAYDFYYGDGHDVSGILANAENIAFSDPAQSWALTGELVR